jgi:hypothetical protein
MKTFLEYLLEDDEYVDYGPTRIVNAQNISLRLKAKGIRHKITGTDKKNPFPNILIHKDDVHKLKLKEDAPDSPYDTPANFNNPNAPKSTHAKNTPDVPTEEDLDFPLDQIDTNPTKRTSEKPFPRY